MAANPNAFRVKKDCQNILKQMMISRYWHSASVSEGQWGSCKLEKACLVKKSWVNWCHAEIYVPKASNFSMKTEIQISILILKVHPNCKCLPN